MHLKRTGGVAGIAREWEMDASLLSIKQARQFKALLDKAVFFSLPRQIQPAPLMRDEFCYQMTIEHGDKKHTVRCADSSIPKALRPCLQWIFKTYP